MSSFHGIGKKTAWERWRSYGEVTTAFLALASAPAFLDNEVMAKIERYVVVA